MTRWLHMLPDEAKTSLHTGETGYDSYLRDAHLQVSVSLCVSVCLSVCSFVCSSSLVVCSK